jgi:glucose-6-phosphate 1-dehydrogenase
MKRSLIILGGSGDLTGRLLLPSLARLDRIDGLTDVDVLAMSQDDWDDDGYRDWARTRLAAHADDLPDDVREGLVGRLRYLKGDVTSSDDLRRARDAVEGAPVFYLALPNTVFRATVDALGALDLTPDARIVLEKPFGKDLDDARELNDALHALLPEESIFRVDHFLAKATVLNVLGLRFANRIFEPVWNAAHVARVEIVADETLGLEGRAGYYDKAGAARDMLQNHLLQLLALVAMEPPLQLDGGGLARRKADVLRAVTPPQDVAAGSVRARYTAGTVGGRELPSYVDEEGVDPRRETETYAEITVGVDNWRWAGVPFRLRSGKALADKRSEIAVHFKPVPHLAFADDVPEPDVLRIRLTPDGITIELNLNGSGDPFDLEREVFTSSPPENDLPAYGLVLHELLQGDTTLSISDVEAEEGWRILEPVLGAWAAGETPLLEYPAGSAGPTRP